MDDGMTSTPDDKSEAILKRIEELVHEYCDARPDAAEGEVITHWGLLIQRTRLIDGEPAYSTSSYQQPHGMAPSQWIGIMQIELGKWMNYTTDLDDGE
jgi:hypothetical protein